MTGVRAAGDSHVGHVRSANEDAVIVDQRRGLYVVLDGMGGASAGDVASQTARDMIAEFVRQNRRAATSGRVLLDAAIQAASRAVHEAATARHDRHGMGTTVVACLIESEHRAVIGHVGDSRAYLLRGGRLIQLTRDHTIVAELVDRGAISAEDAEQHAYKNVLSRNLGAKAQAKVDFNELELKPGDRILLCSDGLYGFASAEAMQYLLGSGDAPEHVARDLIELALRGGGGDNVSAIVIETGGTLPTTTQLVRSSGSIAWWQRRQRFLVAAQERGVGRSPIAASLGAPGEALDLLAGTLCQAVFHDLEKSTGVNVWTFAHNLAIGWLGRGGEWAPLRNLLDALSGSARSVIEELRGQDMQLARLLDTAVTRALVVAELAVGSVLADQLRIVDTELVEIHSARQVEAEHRASSANFGSGESRTFVEQPTLPFVSPHRAMSQGDGASPEILGAVRGAVRAGRAKAGGQAQPELIDQALASIEAIATDTEGTAVAVMGARDLYGVRTVDESGIGPLFDALDRARILATAGVHALGARPGAITAALRRISVAHQRLVGACAHLVIEASAPSKDKLREAQAETAELRAQIVKWERKLGDLERKFATVVDPSTPWEKIQETSP
jgi:serine/threonine protein phosphatase PrpC